MKATYQGTATFSLSEKKPTKFQMECDFGEFTNAEASTIAAKVILQNGQAHGYYQYIDEKGELVTGTFVPTEIRVGE